MAQKKITFDSFIRGVILGGIVIALLMLLKRLSSVLLPFFIAWLIAYMVYPMVTFFQYRLRVKVRILAIFCALFTLLVIGGAVFYFFVPPMLEEFGRVKDLLIAYFSDASYGSNVPSSLSEFLRQNVDSNYLSRLFHQEDFLAALKESLPRIWQLLTESVNLLFSFFTFLLILLYVVFILLDYEYLTSNWIKIFPKKNRPFWHELAGDVERELNNYIRGQCLVALCMGVMFCIGFSIMDFPMAIGLGILIGVMDLVPYLHTFAIIPTAFLAMLKAADTGQNFWVVFGLAVGLFCVVQIITDMIVTPKIMGKAMGLNPAILLLSLSVWGALLGFIGLIIALPLTTLIIAYWQRYVTKEHEEN